ncbi:hypothetical protein fugu_010792 [Takifugu bimaculatus]|uniref:Uncharacterized protein n=1 Tax=Takifugu bimaculatus TaxID=433685 RepID=A0A4Z2CB66_9TELE|nr:hypothetical protein fugu_010792 [Takifugu bimaculatus]
MPSDFLTPFLELEEEFCKSFRSLEAPDGACGPQQRQGLRVAGFQRRHSLCPVTLPNSKFNSSSGSELGSGASAQQWSREGQLPRSSLSHIPFRVDRSVSMIEGGVGHLEDTLLDCSPPGLFLSNASLSSGTSKPATPSPHRPKLRPPLLRHSLSFAGFSSSPHSFQAVAEAAPSALLLARASSVSPSPPSTGSPELLSPLLPEPGPLKHCPYPFSGVPDLPGEDLALHFCAVTDSTRCVSKNIPYHFPQRPPGSFNAPPGLQRCSSADSLSEEGYTSSCSLSSSSSGRESPSSEGRRLPIFSRLSVTDE